MKIVFPTLHVRKSPQATPLAAASLAAAIYDRADCTCRLLDFFPDDTVERITHTVLKASPDLVMVPLYSWNRETMLAVCRDLKSEAPGVIVAGGGPEATADTAGVIKEGRLDCALHGEGESTFIALVESLATQHGLALLPGLSLNRTGEIVHGPDRPPMNPEELPSPWLSGVLKPSPGGGVLWEVARGCRFDCSYCFDNLGSRKVRKLPEERLASELELFGRAGVERIWALDSTFNFPPERGKKLLQLLADHAPGIHVHLEAKVDYLDAEMIQMLALIPCSVQIGIQSFHPQVLRAIHRSLDVASCIERIEQLAEAGITYGFDLIYGLSTDDLDGFRSSLDTALSLQPNQVDIFPLALLPGTRLHEQREKFGLVAAGEPPYEIKRSDTWTTDMLEKARLLAAATDLFYNLGRAVAFFEPIIAVTRRKPVSFLEGFADWMLLDQGVYRSVLTDSECWLPEEILPMQEGYVQFLLLRNQRESLLQASLDLIRYHFHYAETLLGSEANPAGNLEAEDLWQMPWKRSRHIRLVPFYYEILDLLETEEVDIEQFAELFRPVGSVGLFFRRGDEVICESLEEDLLTLLENSDGTKTPDEIFSGSIPRNEGEEVVRFAAEEGFIVPA